MKRLNQLSILASLLFTFTFATFAQASDNNKFPSIKGTNLNGKKYNIPEDMKARYNLLLVAFKREHQKSVNTWLPLASELSKKYKDFKSYEVPVLASGYGLVRGFIDGGMRSGIPDKKTREHTITAYIPKDGFLKSLNLADDSDIHVFLLDDKGSIIWKADGEMNATNKLSAEKFMSEQKK